MSPKAKKTSPADRAEAILRDIALDYPEAYEEFPWGERAIKVRGKIFTFVNRTKEGGSSVTVKLPESSKEALLLPFTEPTHYGMGKYGWVTCRFAANEEPPIDLLEDWIDESFRAVAPKKLVAALDDEEPTPALKKKATKKKPTKKATPKKKPATKKKTVTKKPAAKKKPTRRKKP